AEAATGRVPAHRPRRAAGVPRAVGAGPDAGPGAPARAGLRRPVRDRRALLSDGTGPRPRDPGRAATRVLPGRRAGRPRPDRRRAGGCPRRAASRGLGDRRSGRLGPPDRLPGTAGQAVAWTAGAGHPVLAPVARP